VINMSPKAAFANERSSDQLATAGLSTDRPSTESTFFALPQRRNLAICLLLAAATFVLYRPTIGHPFIPEYDDGCYVTNNLHIQGGVAWTTVTWALSSKKCGNWHPLTWLSHALDYHLYGLNPHGHHVTNLLLHGLNVVLLFLLLQQATGVVGRSLLVASLFAAHPFNVESVVWIAERKNVLSTLFFLLALGTYGWYARRPTLKRYGAVAALFALGLASKPMVITLPCVLLLLDFWPLRRIQGWDSLTQKRPDVGRDPRGGLPISVSPSTAFAVPQACLWWLVLEKLPLLALSAAGAVATIIAQRSHDFMHLELPGRVRLENAIYAYAMYVWKAFCPARLTVFYPHPWTTLGLWRMGLATLFLLSVSFLVWQQRGSRPYLVTGWLWFLGTLVPVSGLIQVGEQAMADRYAYVPLIGIFLMAVWAGADLADAMRVSIRSRAVVAAIVLLILAYLTSIQISYWRSRYDLWSHTLDVTKDNFVGEEYLGVALLDLDRSGEALPHLQRAVQIRPLNASGHLSLGAVLAVNGDIPHAISEFEAVKTRLSDPNLLAVTHEILGRLYYQVGNYSAARADYEHALQISPQQFSARDELAKVESSDTARPAGESRAGELYLRLGQLFQRAGKASEARAADKQALQVDPSFGEAQKALDSLKSRTE
jgi:protein O-mannosyl-transferase